MINLKNILNEGKFYISSKKGLLKSSGSNWKKPQIEVNIKKICKKTLSMEKQISVECL